MSSNIGRLQRVALREVWKHEALDFTQWLQNNIDILNESLDLNLTGPNGNDLRAISALIWLRKMKTVGLSLLKTSSKK